MELKNCRKCGKLFQSYGNRKLCSDCFLETLPTFRIIRDYLYDNPGSNTIDMVNNLRGKGIIVSHSEVLDFIRDDRIEFAVKNAEKKVVQQKTVIIRNQNKGYGFHSHRK